METSKHGVAFIAAYEGFVDHPYRDSGSVWTIGYGHTGAGVSTMGKITHAKALEFLALDVRGAERAVNALGLTLTRSRFDALVSFVFNCGAGTLEPSRSLGRALRSDGMRGVPAAMALYTRDAHGRELAGLVKRRAAEGDLFRKPGAEGPGSWLTEDELRHCREIDELRRLARHTREQERRIDALVRVLTQQRKLIWRRAQPAPTGDGRGWDIRNRRQRYRSLLVRTA